MRRRPWNVPRAEDDTLQPQDHFVSHNAAYAQELYERYLRDPSSVPESWRRIFAANVEGAGLIPAAEGDGRGTTTAAAADAGRARPAVAGIRPGVVPSAAYTGPDGDRERAARAAAELIDAYRLAGHYAARLDPLGREPRGHPILEPTFHDLDSDDLDEGAVADLLDDVLPWLRDTYSGTIGYEFEHLQDPERREWLRKQIETGAHLQPLESDQKERLLERLSEVEAMEQFIHRAYLGQKRFSIEGLDMMVPMLDLAIERAAANGGREVVLGMAHRGRLNVLTHVVGRPYRRLIEEFEGHHQGTGTGDVKYHMGAEGTYATVSGEPLTVSLAPNPSHLEFVDPVVEGMARAKQEDRSGRDLTRDGDLVLPILIHGDAAFPGQGVVAETLNLAELEGYATGGTLHLIANNQIGFTTAPDDGRSSEYASDLARGFDVPIFHVNADDPEACLAVVRLALSFRARFHGDVVIDLIGYRRFGHNEGDEPAYTQPKMYAVIDGHPTVREIWSGTLEEQGVLSAEDAEAIRERAYQRFVDTQDQIRADESAGNGVELGEPEEAAPIPDAETAVAEETLRTLHDELHHWPESFRPNPKLARQLERRATTLREGDGPIDWAHAETLAFAALLVERTPIRLTGQDTERGTFSQRHLALHDVESGEAYTPLANLDGAEAPLQVHNSPLSEIGTLGFEYGYSTAAIESLVLWEAQFGDFVNGAQVIVDQFISSGRVKWGQDSGVVLLLPHGYEGQGPEHSSARIERFLQQAAEDNLRIANCTTPAQYFHLLRRQALVSERRPLVVFTPKSLLRHPRATSKLQDLSTGGFRPVLQDAEAVKRADEIERIVLCSGKVYYDLLDAREESENGRNVALIRLELLYPFPEEELRETLGAFEASAELVWMQEEPANMGAWRYMEPRLRKLLGEERAPRYIGRPERASPAEGYANTHRARQKELTRRVFATGVAASS